MSAALALAPGQATAWLSIGQAAARLGVSRTVIRRLVAERRLTVRTIGCWPRVLAAEVDALAEASTTPAIAE
jgi:excisionase family DNA binding protein